MKQIGRFNVTREQLDKVFEENHAGVPISSMVGKELVIAGFVVYDMGDNTKSIKIFDIAGRDFYTSSQVFIKNLIEYLQTLDDTDFPASVHIEEVQSNKGRKYYTIKEAVSSANNDSWRTINF